MSDELKTSYKISLDFYIRKIITVNAKQLDSDSRVINITCTENGKKFFVDVTTTSAFVRYKKSDGYAVLNQVDILSDGTVDLKLSQQMLAVEGRQLVDIMLINNSELELYTTNVVVEDDDNGNVTVIEEQTVNVTDLNVEEILEAISQNGISVLSTMSFYINTEGCAIDGAEIESSYEYNALVEGLGKMVAVDKRLVELESDVENAVDECNTATNNANVATEAANQATENANTATSKANTATTNANNASKDAQTATENANTATEAANTATSKANTATDNANSAAQETRNIIYNGGIVLKTDIIHDLETEDENKVPDATQVKLLNEMIADLQAQLDAVHKVYYGTEEPTSDIGKDGDIYMMIIEEDATVEVGE